MGECLLKVRSKEPVANQRQGLCSSFSALKLRQHNRYNPENERIVALKLTIVSTFSQKFFKKELGNNVFRLYVCSIKVEKAHLLIDL
jgi:hypothetical protein